MQPTVKAFWTGSSRSTRAAQRQRREFRRRVRLGLQERARFERLHWRWVLLLTVFDVFWCSCGEARSLKRREKGRERRRKKSEVLNWKVKPWYLWWKVRRAMNLLRLSPYLCSVWRSSAGNSQVFRVLMHFISWEKARESSHKAAMKWMRRRRKGLLLILLHFNWSF